MIEFNVTGMTCGGCVNSVKRAVERALPESNAEVDLASGRLQVDVAEESANEVSIKVIAAVEAAGFGAQLLGGEVLGK